MHAMVFALQHNNTKYKQEEKVNTIEKTITLPIHAATASLNVFPRLSLALPSNPFTTTLLALAGIDAQEHVFFKPLLEVQIYIYHTYGELGTPEPGTSLKRNVCTCTSQGPRDPWSAELQSAG